MTRPPLPDPPHRGGCLCGAVRYSYNGRPLAANACHCSDCKKLSGGSHIQMPIADSAAFEHEADEIARWRKRSLYPFAPDAVRVEGHPMDRQVLIDAFNRLYPNA